MLMIRSSVSLVRSRRPSGVPIQLGFLEDVGQVALVVLDDDRDVGRRRGAQVLDHALQRLEVLLQTAALAVDDEHDRVRAGEHVLAHLAVLRLPGHREALDADLEAADAAEIDRQEVEQQGAVLFGVDRHQLDFVARAEDAVHLLQARRLAANADPVVHELGVDRSFRDVDETHRLCPRLQGRQNRRLDLQSSAARGSRLHRRRQWRSACGTGISACQ